MHGELGEDEDYTDEEEDGYLTEDSVDPDDMTYEARPGAWSPRYLKTKPSPE